MPPIIATSCRPGVDPAGARVPGRAEERRPPRPGSRSDSAAAPTRCACSHRIAATLIAEAAWTAHAATTLDRCPDGTGELRETVAATKGAANACGVPVAINEVESNGGSPDDWIELVNRSH
jgi:hypothetical protein